MKKKSPKTNELKITQKVTYLPQIAVPWGRGSSEFRPGIFAKRYLVKHSRSLWMICSGVYPFFGISNPPFYDIISGIVLGGQVISTFSNAVTQLVRVTDKKIVAVIKVRVNIFFILHHVLHRSLS